MNVNDLSNQFGREAFASRHGLWAAAAIAVAVALLSGCATTGPLSSTAARAERETVSAPTPPPVKTAKEARERAEKAFLEHDSDLALYYYLEAVKLDPTDSESFYNIGVLNDRKGNRNLAARAYAQVVAIDPNHAPALQALGLAYFETHDAENAQRMLERAVAADPKLWRAHNVLGVIADTHGDYAEAAKHYGIALTLHPNDASILNNQGYSKYLAGNLDGAERDFQAAIAADAGYERAWHNLGLLYARQHKYDRALHALTKVSSDYVAANDVGYVAMLNGDYDTAGTLFAEAMRLSPRYYQTAEENLVELRKRRGQHQTLAAVEPEPAPAIAGP